jgi:elongator complex protein 3
VQSTDERILAMNGRNVERGSMQRAFELLRVFGFKIHAHAMLNLYGSTPQSDIEEFARFAQDDAYQPDEVKLYPCALIGNAALRAWYEDGRWKPYSEAQLVDVLAADVAATAPYTRISRMIRDFSSHDIQAGNKKTNLRQLVEGKLESDGTPVSEIRFREIGVRGAGDAALTLDEVAYRTAATDERFLQWVTPEGKIAGFLRLSLPHADALASRPGVPIAPGEAMIREVHVYGTVARIGDGWADGAAQHRGLGKQLVTRACAIACDAGYHAIKVISAVGTRGYYRGLGFHEEGLYQRKEL